MKNLVIFSTLLTNLCWHITNQEITGIQNISHSDLIYPKIETISEEITLDGFLLPKKITPIFLLEQLPIEKIHVADGDFVNKGDCLLTYNIYALQQQKQLIQRQVANLEQKTVHPSKKEENHWKNKLVNFFHPSNQQIKQLQKDASGYINSYLQTQIEKLHAEIQQITFLEQQQNVYAPHAGQVVFQNEQLDTLPTAIGKSPIFSIVDTQHLRGCFYANLYQLPLLQVGIPISIYWDGTNQSTKGSIEKIHKTPKKDTRLYEIDVNLSPTTRKDLPIGMTGTGQIVVSTHAHALTIPKACIQYKENQTFVYTIQNNKIIKTPIEIGITTPTFVEVIHGLHKNDWILQTNLDEVYEGQSIKILGGKHQ